MTLSEAASYAVLDFFCTHEEIFLAYEKIWSGCPVPGNVVRDVDPYQYSPFHLPDGIWYYIEGNGNAISSSGYWKPKGEDCQLYSKPSYTGWRTTFEYYEGQTPYEKKTAWVMEKYWISLSESSENSGKKEASSLCRIFLGDEMNYEMLDNSIISSAEPINPNHLITSDASNNMKANESTSRSQISEDDKMVELAVAGKPLNDYLEGLSEIDCLRRGDFLQLQDLDTPVSPLSSSDNSSCLSMSSDEYFDSDALLRELEYDISQDMEKRGAACKFNPTAATIKLKKVELHQHAPETLVSNRANDPRSAKNLKTDCSVPSSCASGEVGEEEDNMKHLNQNQKVVYRLKGQSSCSSTNGKETAVGGEKKATVGRMKKIQKKYLCFIPF